MQQNSLACPCKNYATYFYFIQECFIVKWKKTIESEIKFDKTHTYSSKLMIAHIKG